MPIEFYVKYGDGLFDELIAHRIEIEDCPAEWCLRMAVEKRHHPSTSAYHPYLYRIGLAEQLHSVVSVELFESEVCDHIVGAITRADKPWRIELTVERVGKIELLASPTGDTQRLLFHVMR